MKMRKKINLMKNNEYIVNDEIINPNSDPIDFLDKLLYKCARNIFPNKEFTISCCFVCLYLNSKGINSLKFRLTIMELISIFSHSNANVSLNLRCGKS